MKRILTKKQKEIEKEKEAEQILKNMIREIKHEIPEFVYALNLLKLHPIDVSIRLSTDFENLYYNADYIINLRKNDGRDEIKFQIVHILLHGLLGHADFARYGRQKKELWLAMDQKVNDFCTVLGYQSTDKNRNFYMKKMKENSPYKECFGNYFLAKENGYIRKKAKAAQRLIASDNHFFWSPEYRQKVLLILQNENENDSTGKDGEKQNIGAATLAQMKQTISKWEVARALLGMDKNNSINGNPQMSKYANKNAGRGAGNQVVSTQEAQGKAMDYKEIIHELLREREDPREVPDSIDPMLYQYGIDLYGDMPLIEPREGEEMLRLNTLAIAIDTSGSCSNHVAETFVREIKGIFRDTKESIQGGNIILFQCDDVIQKETHLDINEMEQLETDSMELYGYGGTDFRPVFERLDEVEKEEEVIDALLYLTDGFGEVPSEQPKYPVYFIMRKDDAEYHRNYKSLPSWIRYGVIEE